MVKNLKPLDNCSFQELFNKYEPYLYKAAYAYLGTKDDALDAMQETAYRAYKNRKKLHSTINLKAWLLRILINYCKDYSKKKNRIIYINDISLLGKKQPSKTFENSLNTDLLVHEAIGSLKSPYKEVLILRYMNDLTIKDISKILKKPESTIKTWLYKALKDMECILNKEDLEYVP